MSRVHARTKHLKTIQSLLFTAFIGGVLLVACSPQANVTATPQSTMETATPPTTAATVTPFPTRRMYNPGELVAYTTQTGDTLPALAAHFNTSIDEILAANPIIPVDVTTLPPGLPMEMPIYYRPFWGSPYQILPDSQFVNGPAVVDFDTAAFVAQYPGWLKDYREYAAGENRSGAGVIDYVAGNFSVSPRVLLALLEYQAGALSQTIITGDEARYPLGYQSRNHVGLYLQLVWAANKLNNGYYGWRTGTLTTLEHPDGTLETIDPWQNAASVALQHYFNALFPQEAYPYAIGPEGFAQTYSDLFGDPWVNEEAHIPGSLQQPEFTLPFEPGKTWAYTGGPHTGWGAGLPLAALDFAPPATITGCQVSSEWATAVADGVVVRSETGIVVLDLDKDGDARTGWAIFYLHVATRDRAPIGTELAAGDPIGHPSCEGGITTGTHIHLARKYNGEWISADSALPFVMEGWRPHNGDDEYDGLLTRFEHTVTANVNADQGSFIQARGLEEGGIDLIEEPQEP